MSVSIGWKPKDPNGLTYIDGGSTLHGILEKAFGCFPMTLSSKNIKVLEGVAACGYEGVYELITAICDNEVIAVDDEW